MRKLDDYLYEINSEYTKKEGAKHFYIIDIIFIIGDALIQPWTP